MKKKSVILGAVILVVVDVFAVVGSRAALVIDLPSNVTTPADGHLAGSSNPGRAGIAEALGISMTALGSLLYKIEGDGSEAGLLRCSYGTLNAGADDFTSAPITIRYNGGDWASATYLLVKDGNLGSYVFNIGPGGLNWNGTDDILVGSLFDPFKDITGTSHVEFYGAKVTVPEPATAIAGALLLLPFAISTIRLLYKARSVSPSI